MQVDASALLLQVAAPVPHAEHKPVVESKKKFDAHSETAQVIVQAFELAALVEHY